MGASPALRFDPHREALASLELAPAWRANRLPQRCWPSNDPPAALEPFPELLNFVTSQQPAPAARSGPFLSCPTPQELTKPGEIP